MADLLPAILTGAAPAGERVKLPSTNRTGSPVRRRSYHEGHKEHLVWRPIGNGTKKGGRRFAGAFLRAAEKFDHDQKQPGRANGPLGHIALQILRVMLRVADYKTGRIDPSLDTLMRWTKRSRSAVVAALARLRQHGFLDWIRRTAPIENPDPFGPQVRQISNAYGIDATRLPEQVQHVLSLMLGRKAPAPDDASWSREQDAAGVRQMIEALPLVEQPGEIASVMGGDSQITDALTRLAKAINGSNASLPAGLNPETEV